MTTVMNQMPSQTQSPTTQMSVNRIMDNTPQSPTGTRHLPPPTGTVGDPPFFSANHDGRIYSLEIVQQPTRARMCGFGDKDRRPITPPPCIRLRVQDAATRQPLDINEIDISYFILTVDLWSGDGKAEANLVRHSATSPSISAATSTSYPPEHSAMAYAPNVPVMGTQFYPGYEAAQPNYSGAPYPVPRQNELARHMQAAQQATRDEAIRIQQEQQRLQNEGHHHHLPKANSSMHPSTQSYMTNAGSMTATANNMPYSQQSHMSYQQLSPNPMMNVVDPRSHPGGMFTRNLIGNLAVGAFKLTYPENDLGVWFILQDLSVRTEGTFRLKINFVDVGMPASAPSPEPAPGAVPRGQQNPSLQTGKLNTGQAPVLASCYSNEFQVYSAKKFPGVVDSTDLSKAFAKQGIKIPIRKDGGNVRGNERREWDEGD